jgi:ubiquinone/menaquinone biosynthesis C-methylase UbiE
MAYQRSAQVYDAIYGFKDYAREVALIRDLVAAHSRRPCRTLLDVAAGTGVHLAFLQEHFTVEGLDLEPAMLARARERLPDAPLHEANMTDFDLGKQFDVITCLFSSIGYLLTVDALNRAAATFARHLQPGGVLLLEPWFSPEAYRPGTLHATFVDQPDLKISRMVQSERDGDFAVMHMHHLVATPEEGVRHFVETHTMRLFTGDDYLSALEHAHLNPVHVEGGLTGRGLYIGVKG